MSDSPKSYVAQDGTRILHIYLHEKGIYATRYRRNWLTDNTFSCSILGQWSIGRELASKARPEITKIQLCSMVHEITGQIDNPLIRHILQHKPKGAENSVAN